MRYSFEASYNNETTSQRPCMPVALPPPHTYDTDNQCSSATPQLTHMLIETLRHLLLLQPTTHCLPTQLPTVLLLLYACRCTHAAAARLAGPPITPCEASAIAHAARALSHQAPGCVTSPIVQHKLFLSTAKALPCLAKSALHSAPQPPAGVCNTAAHHHNSTATRIVHALP